MVRRSIRVCLGLFLCSLPLFAQSGETQKALTPAVGGTGSANFMARWTNSTTIAGSNIFQNPTTGVIGINTSTPAATLDVKGTAAVRDTFTLFPNGTHPVLSLSGTVFKVSSTGLVTFVAGQTFPGTGTVTSITAGAGLAGGTITKTGTLTIATAGVTNGMLAHSSLTVATGAGLTGGGGIALGGTRTLSIPSGGVTNTMLQHPSLTVGTSTGLTGGAAVALGGSVSLAIDQSVVPTLGGINFFTGFSDFDGNEPGWEVEVSNAGAGDAIIASNTSVDSSHPTLSLTNNDSSAAGDLVLDALGPNFGGECSIDVTGNLFCTGTLAAVVKAGSQRSLGVYSVQSPENWIEDFGSGALFGGVATIQLEPGFAKTISAKADYHVFLTPAGECEGLYVAGRTATSFEVRELRRGTSNVAFDYRIVAHRKGLESARLPVVKMGTRRTATPQGSVAQLPGSR